MCNRGTGDSPRLHKGLRRREDILLPSHDEMQHLRTHHIRNVDSCPHAGDRNLRGSAALKPHDRLSMRQSLRLKPVPLSSPFPFSSEVLATRIVDTSLNSTFCSSCAIDAEAPHVVTNFDGVTSPASSADPAAGRSSRHSDLGSMSLLSARMRIGSMRPHGAGCRSASLGRPFSCLFVGPEADLLLTPRKVTAYAFRSRTIQGAFE